MVDAAVPVKMTIAQMQKVDDDETVRQHVDRSAVVVAHPGFGNRCGIVLATQIYIGDGVVERLVHVLVRDSIDLDEVKEPGPEFPPSAFAGLGQQVEIDVTLELDVLRDCEGNVTHRMLSEPDTALRS